MTGVLNQKKKVIIYADTDFSNENASTLNASTL